MSQFREELIERLFEDIIGPHQADEVLQNKPSDIYLSGILWPSRSHIPLLEDDGDNAESEDDDIAPGLSIAGQQRPSAMGVSFATNSHNLESYINVSFTFATYVSELSVENEDKVRNWTRKLHSNNLNIRLHENQSQYIKIEGTDIPKFINIGLHIRTVLSGDLLLATVTLMNQTQLTDEDFIHQEESTLFQTKLIIQCVEKFQFTGLPDLRVPLDEDEESTRLLYRNELNYAFGHQCSSTWDMKNLAPQFIQTDWLPVANVPSFSQEGHEVFQELVANGKLSAKLLAESSDDLVLEALNELNIAYRRWIDLQIKELVMLDSKYLKIARDHIGKCEVVLERMHSGVKFLQEDPSALLAFKHANMAMHIQHEWKTSSNSSSKSLSWRPFQLAFILLTLESICDGESEYRNTLDLLWFPTGGGKTEAYLALIAMGSWYRRLTIELQGGGGNFAVMRYTLRLLTAQQFERASAVILACELIRTGLAYEFESESLDCAQFSIGLWVGGDATPNSYNDAVINRGNEFLSSPEQINFCYSCSSKLSWNYDDVQEIVRPSCSNQECVLGPEFGVWPVLTVDDDIFRSVPTVIIGTVDKFAQVPLKLETSRVFGFKNNLGTELIIQDELHLISGPLGTIVGIYEVAFDWLLTRDGIRPKVIGSTATIRRASSQVRALFDRESCQFPPSGLNFEDSGFAIVNKEAPGRDYLGITTSGRSAKFTLQAVAGSLLQSGDPARAEIVDAIDGYTTLLMYFNALRELGGAIVQVLDDVPDSMSLYASQRDELPRQIEAPKELTSRVSQREIVSILSDLAKPANTENSVDVVLATNMVSVGVDVPRLGLMLVNGQPKTRAEYIQSTSRVGRSSFPGLVVGVFNALKARDRSHFETFSSIHQSLYRDVEATSVTPFASRARDRALRAVLISMIRHSDSGQRDIPDFKRLKMDNLKVIIGEIERRVQNVDPGALTEVQKEIDEALIEWSNRDVRKYLDNSLKGRRMSLLQYAEDYARRLAAGNLGGSAWPVMNTMRSVEASTPFRLKERMFRNLSTAKPGEAEAQQFPWRRNNDSQ